MEEAVLTHEKVAKKAPKASKKPAKKGSHQVRTNPRSEGLFAVIATGGKQYRVQAGDMLKIEKLPGEHKEGDTITFDNVLMTDNGAGEVTLGNPFLKGVSVSATLKKIARYKTIDVIKYKQKSRYFKKYGHRQPYFEVQIDSVK
jgi:large subunit ribosomal protein L21